jgi:nitric oxide dioxygenase
VGRKLALVSFVEGRAMTPDQIRMVQTSFAYVIPVADQAAAVFYRRLFELDPAARLLFRDTGPHQGMRLMTALTAIVRHLGNHDLLLPTLSLLAVRHVGYGVTERHYDTVGRALLWTLEEALGSNFTTPVREAWQAAYCFLASTMIRAAREASVKVA